MLRIMLAALALLARAACAQAETIAFAQVGSESDWRVAFTNDVKAEAAKRGINLIYADAANDVERQRAAVRDFINRHVDAIVIAPVVVGGWSETLKAAKAAGIPVFIADRAVDADPSLYVARIAASSALEGRLAAAWLAQATGGSCGVVELQGTPGSEPAIQRHQGFLAVAALFPGMRVLHSANGNFTTEGGSSAMTELIRETNGLRGVCAIWSHNDNMLLGALQTMRNAGLEPTTNLLTVSFDGVSSIYHAMLEGTATMSVEVKTQTGAYIFDVVQGYLAGKRNYPKWVVIPSALHTKADAATMLDQTHS